MTDNEFYCVLKKKYLTILLITNQSVLSTDEIRSQIRTSHQRPTLNNYVRCISLYLYMFSCPIT